MHARTVRLTFFSSSNALFSSSSKRFEETSLVVPDLLYAVEIGGWYWDRWMNFSDWQGVSTVSVSHISISLTHPPQVTSPVASTTFTAGQQATISWQESGSGPTLKEFGVAKVSIYVGNAQQQVLLSNFTWFFELFLENNPFLSYLFQLRIRESFFIHRHP